MSILTENSCDIVTNAINFKYAHEECAVGRDQFLEDIRPLVKIRHEIGEARLKADHQALKRLEKKLSSAAKPVERKYNKNYAPCYDNLEDVACGYCSAYEKYAENVGVLSEYKESKGPRSKLNILVPDSVMLVADIDGDHEALFDTGCENSIFSQYWLVENSVVLSSVSVWASQHKYLSEGVKLMIGNLEYSPPVIGQDPVIDNLIEGVRNTHSLVSIIGMDFLLKQNFSVDNDNSTFTLNEDVDAMFENGNWQRLPIGININERFFFEISVDVYINGQLFHMLLDTGAQSTIVFASCVDDLSSTFNTDKTYRFIDVYGQHASKGDERAVVRFADINVDAPVRIDDDKERGKAKDFRKLGYCGLLGENSLRKINYIVDPSTHSLYVTRRKTEPKYYEWAGMDIHFVREENGVVITDIGVDGPTSRSTLKVGDIVTEIYGIDVNDIGRQGIEILFMTKTELPVVYVRDGKKYSSVIKLDKDTSSWALLQ